MPKNRNRNPLIKYLIAVFLGLAIFFVTAFILSFTIISTPYPKENMLLYALISIGISSFFASFIYCFKERKNGLLSGLIIGAVLTAIYYLIFSAFSSFNINESSILIIPISIGASAIAGITAVNIKHKK